MAFDPFVVRGVSSNGTVLYWTGKAGEAWFSPNRADAFICSHNHGYGFTIRVNKMTRIHGIHATVQPVEGR